MRYILDGVVIDSFFRNFNAAYPFTHAEKRFTVRVSSTYSIHYNLIVMEADNFRLFRYERPISICFFSHFTAEADFYFLCIGGKYSEVYPTVFAYTGILGPVDVVFVGNCSFRKTLLLGVHC